MQMLVCPGGHGVGVPHGVGLGGSATVGVGVVGVRVSGRVAVAVSAGAPVRWPLPRSPSLQAAMSAAIATPARNMSQLNLIILGLPQNGSTGPLAAFNSKIRRLSTGPYMDGTTRVKTLKKCGGDPTRLSRQA